MRKLILRIAVLAVLVVGLFVLGTTRSRAQSCCAKCEDSFSTCLGNGTDYDICCTIYTNCANRCPPRPGCPLC